MTTVHCCISVRGMLAWNRTETKRNLRSIKKGDGTPFSGVEEFRNHIMDELSKGRKVLPLSYPPCEGFDYAHGCPGHENTEEEK